MAISLEVFLLSFIFSNFQVYIIPCDHQSRCDEILFSRKASLLLHSLVHRDDEEKTGDQDRVWSKVATFAHTPNGNLCQNKTLLQLKLIPAL